MDITDIFENEESDFTPWLCDNLNKLESILKRKELDLKEKEKYVGTKRLDILAEDQEGDLIAIENQFGVSDFRHLGQILTYGVGTKAQEIVWIAERFHQVHLETFKWLDENKRGIKFKAISVENPINNNKPDNIRFRKPKKFQKPEVGEKLEGRNQDKIIDVDEQLLDLIDQYQEENPNAQPVQKGLLTGKVIRWIYDNKSLDTYNKYFDEVDENGEPVS